MKKVAVIGAGISGLFIANLFKRNKKYKVTIFERNSLINLKEGYGIQLSVNSIKLLNKIQFDKLENNEKFNPDKINFYSVKNLKKICELNISNFNTENIKNIEFFQSERVDIELLNKKKIRFPINYTVDNFNFALKLLDDDRYSKSKILDLRIPNKVITYD